MYMFFIRFVILSEVLTEFPLHFLLPFFLWWGTVYNLAKVSVGSDIMCPFATHVVLGAFGDVQNYRKEFTCGVCVHALPLL